MNRTSEQQAADHAVEQAIRQSIEAYGHTVGPDAYVDDWLVVTQVVVHLDGSGGGYHVLMPTGGIPAHRARGLLAVAETLLESNE